MEEKRRFSRVTCDEMLSVESGNSAFDARLLDISLKGALVEIENEITLQKGDKWQLTLKLNNSDIILQFRAEVVHYRKNVVGLKFIHIDLDSFIHLRSLMEARTSNPEQVAGELEFLV